jgi:hypothetical protein
MPLLPLLEGLVKNMDADSAASSSATASLDFGFSSSFDSAQVSAMANGWLLTISQPLPLSPLNSIGGLLWWEMIVQTKMWGRVQATILVK